MKENFPEERIKEIRIWSEKSILFQSISGSLFPFLWGNSFYSLYKQVSFDRMLLYRYKEHYKNDHVLNSNWVMKYNLKCVKKQLEALNTDKGWVEGVSRRGGIEWPVLEGRRGGGPRLDWSSEWPDNHRYERRGDDVPHTDHHFHPILCILIETILPIRIPSILPNTLHHNNELKGCDWSTQNV